MYYHVCIMYDYCRLRGPGPYYSFFKSNNTLWFRTVSLLSLLFIAEQAGGSFALTGSRNLQQVGKCCDASLLMISIDREPNRKESNRPHYLANPWSSSIEPMAFHVVGVPWSSSVEFVEFHRVPWTFSTDVFHGFFRYVFFPLKSIYGNFHGIFRRKWPSVVVVL